ncbi:hypothetical protein OpiT1DRAFT_03146 [Opitutaceae bacterium TAV1]|nr:hypothetical protein OpiT1DRAFT_03146 [Opitutaceae bacterium TAV1]
MKTLTLARLAVRGLAPLAALALAAATAHAQATWYLKDNMPKETSWRSLSVWSSTPDGSGPAPTAISPADIYNTNGKLVRTAGVFTAGKLLQDGGRIDMKRASQTLNGDWEVTGDKAILHQGVRDNASYVFTVKGKLILTAPLTVLHTSNGMRGIDLTIGTLTGASGLLIGSGNAARNTTVSLGVLKFDNYTGKVVVQSGSTLAFANDQTWTGPLEVVSGAYLTLNKVITVPAATIAGQPLAAGTYTADQLKQTHAAVITEGSAGTLTVAP